MFDERDRQWLYERMQSAGVNTGSYEEFKSSLNNQEDRDWYYNKSREIGLDVGSQDDFTSMMVEQPQAARQAQPQTAAYNPPTLAGDGGVTYTPGEAVEAETRKPIKQQQRESMERFRNEMGGKVESLARSQEGMEERVEAAQEAVDKGSRPFSSGRESRINPVTGQLEDVYYTKTGEKVATPMEKAVANGVGDAQVVNAINNLTEEVFGKSAEGAWAAAEARTQEAMDGQRAVESKMNDKLTPFGRAVMMSPENQRNMAMTDAVNYKIERMTNHDMQRMSDEAWDGIGIVRQQSIIEGIYNILHHRYPDIEESKLREEAENIARGKSDEQMFRVAVEKNMPKDVTEFFARKVVGANLLSNLFDIMVRKEAGTTGDMEARDVAMQKYGDNGHKFTGFLGTAFGMAIDPTMWISGGVGGAVAKGVLWGAGKGVGAFAARKATGALAKGVAETAGRKFAGTLTGRIVSGVVGGAGNFATFEAANEALQQGRYGGHVELDEETGRYKITGYKPEEVFKKMGHGAMLGGTIGLLGPLTGNVGDMLTQSAKDTLVKMGVRAGQMTFGKMTEGTIFSVPEWIETYRQYEDLIASLSDVNSKNYIEDAFAREKRIEELKEQRGKTMMDVWTDNEAMMLAFGVQGLVKSAPKRIAEVFGTEGGRAGFETRLRTLLNGRPGMSLTKDEKSELRDNGYTDLAELVEGYMQYKGERSDMEAEGNQKDMVYTRNRFISLMQDANVSEAAKAKMYYYVTGNMLPMSTVMGVLPIEEVKDESGNVTGYNVKSVGARGVVISRTFDSRERAETEVEAIMRQAELNGIEVGEKYRDSHGDEMRMLEACKPVAERKAVTPESLLKMMKKDPEKMSRAERKWAEEVTAIYENIPVDDYTSAGLRGQIREEYGVDVDDVIKKEPNRRSGIEQEALTEYMHRLFEPEERMPVKYEDTPYQRGYDADEDQRRDIAVGVANKEEDAQRAWEGVQQRIEDDADYKAAEAREEHSRLVHKGADGKPDGTTRPVTMKDKDENGQPIGAYVVDGNVVMRNDGTVDEEASDQMLTVYYPATGETKPVALGDIAEYGEVVTDEAFERELEEVRAADVKEQLDVAAGKIREGMDVALPDGRPSVILAIGPEGVSLINPDDVGKPFNEQQPIVVSVDEAQVMADAWALAKYKEEHPEPQRTTEGQQPMEEQQPRTAVAPEEEVIVDDEAPVEEEPIEEVVVDDGGQVEGGEVAEEVVAEDEEPVSESAGTYRDMVAKYGDKTGHKLEVTVNDRVAEVEKAKKALQKAQADYDDAPIGKEEKAEAALGKAQEAYDAARAEWQKWDAVMAEHTAVEAQAKAEAKAKEEALEKALGKEPEEVQMATGAPEWMRKKIREANGNRKYLLRQIADEMKDDPAALEVLSDETPRTLEEVVATLLTGSSKYPAAKVMLNDEKVGSGVVRGLKSMSGYSSNDAKKLRGVIAPREKGGISPEELGERVIPFAREYGIPLDGFDATAGLNAVLGFFGQVSTPSDINNYILNNRIDEARKLHQDAINDMSRRFMEEYGVSMEEYDAWRDMWTDLLRNVADITEEDYNKNIKPENDEQRGQEQNAGELETEKPESVGDDAGSGSQGDGAVQGEETDEGTGPVDTGRGAGEADEGEAGPTAAAGQPAGEVAESREERDRRLQEERKRRILAEGTSFDKPFGLTPVSETMTPEEIGANVRRIVEGLKQNEGSGDFEGFAYNGNYKKNAGHQVDEYLVSLSGVVPDETLRQWYESEGLNTRDDLRALGEKLYGEAGQQAVQPKSADDYRQQAEKAIADILDGVERGGNGPVVSDETTEAIQRIADMEADAEERLEAGVEDADEKARLEAQRDAAEKWMDENVRSQKTDGKASKTGKRDKAILGALVDKLREFLGKNRVITKLSEAQKALIDWANARMQGTAPVFYSNAERAVESIKQEKATAEQWLAMIQKTGGLKAGEDKWMGLSEWLNDHKGESLTKQQVLDYIRANEIQIEEVEYSEDTIKNLQEEYDKLVEEKGDKGFAWSAMNTRYMDNYNVYLEDYVTNYDGRLEIKRGKEYGFAKLGLQKPINNTRLGYTTDGLDNKREIALTVPTIEPWNEGDDVHFGDAGNGRAVAWVRFGETTDADGKRVLVIDEIQSKRHQEGREKGYTKYSYNDEVKARKAFNEERARLCKKYDIPLNPQNESIGKIGKLATEEEKNNLQSLYDKWGEIVEENNKDTIPDAPFDKNWHEVAMKRMLRFAAENGYDKVAWTNGEQQAERYDLSKHVEIIYVSDWSKTPRGETTRMVTVEAEDNNRLYLPVNKDGVIVGDNDYAGKSVSEVFGKSLSERIMADGIQVIEGEDLRIGGDGMKGFYDQILPRFMDKYCKKWGVKTTDLELPGKEGDIIVDDVLRHALTQEEIDRLSKARPGLTMHSVEVTPEMKESVLEGQPMFFRTPDGEVYGFTLDGRIYIDTDIAKADTPIHEYTHLWVPMVKEADPKLWQEIKDVLTKDKDVQPFMEIVRKRYPELTKEGHEDDFMEEVLAHFSGAKGLERLEEAAREFEKEDGQGLVSKAKAVVVLNKVKSALEKFWGKVAELFGRQPKSAADVADMILSDLLHGVDPTAVRSEREEKTLMGIHNISEEKLKKALKNGGFANPSMAVIDTRHGVLDSYGDISLIPKSSLIDAETGRNAGTYSGDAYTPTYPNVYHHKGRDTEKKLQELTRSLPQSIGGYIRRKVSDYVANETITSGLEYLFLKERGTEMPIAHNERRHPDISKKAIAERMGVNEGLYGMDLYREYEKMPEDQRFDFNLWLEKHGNEEEIEDIKNKIAEFRRKGVDKAVDMLLEKYAKPLTFASFDTLVYQIGRDEREAGEENLGRTVEDAAIEVNKQGLRNEFDAWQQKVIDGLGYEERLFAGYTRDGNRKYLPNTAENASKLMNNQEETNAGNDTGLNATRAALLYKMRSLDDIRQHRDLMKGDDAYGERQGEMTDKLLEIAHRLSDMQKIDDNPYINTDYAVMRMQEAFTKKDPVGYLNREYGYDIDKEGEFAKQMLDFIKEVKDMPVKYFETKFKRPVALDEFAVAVVPEGTSQEVVDALKDAGLDVRTYDGTSENRQAVTLEAVRGRDDIMFQFAGERGAEAADKAEEVTHRMDNLGVAREMESSGKDAKAVKMATGWERGADGKFVRILQQPFVDFENNVPLTPAERTEFMEGLGFHPINSDKTAFSNGEIIVADLQKSNIVKDGDGNIQVIDADVRLHTKDMGGEYEIRPVELELSDNQETNLQETENEVRTREADSRYEFNPYSPYQTYEESLASAKAAGYTKRQHDAMVERRKKNYAERGQRAKEMAEKLNLGDRVEILENADGLPERFQNKKGWYNPGTGRITIVLDRHGSMDDVLRTILHEGVGHHGLRELFGRDNFDNFLDNVYKAAQIDIRRKIAALASKHGWNVRTATEEYMAEMAETMDFEKPEHQTWWMKIKQYFYEMLHKLGIKGADISPESIGDNELRYLLWRSYQNLVNPGRFRSLVGQAEDVAMQWKLKVGQYEEKYGELSTGTIGYKERQRHNERLKAAEAEANEVVTTKNNSQNAINDSDINVARRAFNDILTNSGVTFSRNFSFKNGSDYYTFSIKDTEGERETIRVRIADHPKPAWQNSSYVEGKNDFRNYKDAYDYLTKYFDLTDKTEQIEHARRILESQVKEVEENGRVWYKIGNDGLTSTAEAAVDNRMRAYVIPRLTGELREDFTFRDLYNRNIHDTPRLPMQSKDNITDVDNILFREGEGETDDIWQDRTIGMEEKMTAAAARLASNHEGDAERKTAAMRAVGGNLASLRKAMRLQKEFDKGTVKRVTDLARILVQEGYLDNMRKGEVKRLLSAVKNATGKEDITANVNTIMDIMVDSQLRKAEESLSRLMHIRGSKVDARGVEVQGQLDVEGQEVMKVFKDAHKWSEDEIAEAMGEAENRIASDNAAVSEAALREYTGLQLALEYARNIAESEREEQRLRSEKKTALLEVSDDERDSNAFREYLDSVDDAIRQNKIERAVDYQLLVGMIYGGLKASMENAEAFKEADKARIREIQHNANSDMEGKPSNEHYKAGWLDKLVNNSFSQFVFKPLSTFEQTMRLFGGKSVNGEGYLYNRFVRGWTDAREKEIRGVREKYAVLDEKVKSIFGKDAGSMGELIRKIGRMPKAEVEFWDGGAMREHTLTQGNLLYIYMVDKMEDGRMKLRKMGIDEKAVNRIMREIDPRLMELADWMQEEFLVDTRNEYNETHKRLFGAPMAAIENYFPLKVLANARVDKAEDLDNPEANENTISTKTGSIIKRRRNALALDLLNADALNVVLDHVTQMEHWNAYAEFNRDLNTLRTYKRFRNQVKNMRTVYGSGELLWKKFNDVCQMAAGTYRPPKAQLDEAAVNIAKGVTAAKVSFRIFTALKQFLSMPAYLPDARPDLFVKNIATPWKAWSWTMENLPIFEERWKSRIAGDPRLLKSEMDWKGWRNNVVQIASRIGMSPNAFVDALTVSIGARTIYETRKARYLKEGYSEVQAEKRAKQDAEISYNLTQQSSEGAFMSTMQVDRSWLSVVFTVFRNASMSYQRQLHDALRNLAHRFKKGYKEKSIEFMAKQMEREGVDVDKAWEAAKSRYDRQLRKDLIRVATFGYILQFAWNLGPYLPYLLFGDDDDKKKKMWHDVLMHSLFGWTEGLTGGDVLSAAGNMLAKGEGNPEYLKKEMPVTSDVYDILKKIGNGKYGEVLNDVVNLVVQVGIGVNPQSITDSVLAVMDFCGDDPKLAREGLILAMRILQVPQSQIRDIYFDEIGMSGEEASKFTPEQLVERYARYQVKRGQLITPWAWDDEEKIAKQEKQAEKIIKERADRFGSEETNEAYEGLVDEMKDWQEKEKAYDKAKRESYVEAAKVMAEIQKDPEGWKRYKHFKTQEKRLDKAVKEYMMSETPEEAQKNRKDIEEIKDKMVEELAK